MGFVDAMTPPSAYDADTSPTPLGMGATEWRAPGKDLGQKLMRSRPLKTLTGPRTML